MRTEWQPNGYGHLFSFSSDGSLAAGGGARCGAKNGREVRLDGNGRVVGTTRFEDGRDTNTEKLSNAPPEGLEVSESPRQGSSGPYVMLRQYSRSGQVVESRWYLPDSTLAIRSVFGDDGYGHSFFFRDDGSIRVIAEGQYGRFDGLALEFTEDGEQVSKLYVGGVLICSQ
jgi:hypothetical protein